MMHVTWTLPSGSVCYLITRDTTPWPSPIPRKPQVNSGPQPTPTIESITDRRADRRTTKMSYYFTILSPTDVPLFNIAFGTSKSGGDGIARFRFPDTAQYMNQFIIHSSLDIVEEAQWMNGNMYIPFFLIY